jgi:hypothetical protein
MLFRFTKLWVAIGLLIALWGLSAVRQSGPTRWIRPIGTPPGPVKILQFYASVGTLMHGDKALLCYGVENAKSVKISPMLDGVYPSLNHCLEIVPEHTTHYTIVAEGFDGKVAMQSFTLPVQDLPEAPPRRVHYAGIASVHQPDSRIRPAVASTTDTGI